MGIAGPHFLRDTLASMPIDRVRGRMHFDHKLLEVSEVLWSATATEDERRASLLSWIGSSQPCIFGKIASQESMISLCILSRSDIEEGDAHVLHRIQNARLGWLRSAAEGMTNGFVILVADRELAHAEPGEQLQTFSQRLAYLYLLRTVQADAVYHDEVALRIPTEPDHVLQWLAGVNFFAAQGDGRWWQDHRIPGGVGFSVNSVGHFIAVARRRTALGAMQAAFPSAVTSELADPHLGSLDDALSVAMLTISRASTGPHAPATYLVKRATAPQTAREHRVAKHLPKALEDKEFRLYRGQYHTDWTVPSVYFHPRVKAPEAEPIDLDFTYLYDDDIENIDHITMGVGRRVRDDQAQGLERPARRELAGRLTPERVRIEDCPVLSRALHLGQ